MGVNINKQGIVTAGGSVNPNLVPNSYINTTSNAYGYGSASFNIVSGKTYTVQARGYISNASITSGTTLKVYFYKSDWSYCPVILSINSTSELTVCATFTANQTTSMRISSYSFKAQNTPGDPVTTIWYKVEEGSTPTPWIPNFADTIYTGNYVGFIEGCSSHPTASIAKSGQILATEFIEI